MSSTQGAGYQPAYHNVTDAAYVLPNDSSEHNRLNNQAYHLSAIMDHQVLHAPLNPDSPGLRILDVGCGTGVVTDYLGDKFPNAEVYGLDLSPTPSQEKRPANIRFLQGNVLTQTPDQWVALDGTRPLAGVKNSGFDLVFGRLLVCGMTDWPGFVRKGFELLRPGGYLEVHDLDWIWYDKDNRVISEDWPWWVEARAAGRQKKLNFECGTGCKQWMREEGCSDIVVKKYRWPWGVEGEETPALREFAEYSVSFLPLLFYHTIEKLMEGSAASADEIQYMREDMKKRLAAEKGKYWNIWVTTGRKA